MTIQSSDIQKLAKLLGMIGSNHDGEALAAARKAYEMVERIGTTWPDLLQVPVTVDTVAEQPAHRSEAQRLLHEGKGVITDFERNFLVGIMTFQTLYPKQVELLEGIKFKVNAGST